MIKEDHDLFRTAPTCCNVERSIEIVVSSIDIGLSIKKELDALKIAIFYHMKMALICCKVERSIEIVVSSIDIGLSIKKELDESTIASTCCVVER